MRLHRLAMTAFGPYRNTVQVDFDALGADGLFLLHGETGAGKTTLLDGVAYALFGQVPGARGQVRRLRCDQAPDTVATRVELEVTIQGHRLRIVRSPEFERRKKRGEGTTTVQAKVSLAWLGGVPDGYPDGLSRIDEVARTVSRLLGMTHQQFFQVVLLPQGEFARFLRADTDEREQLLEQLFGTQRFAETEKWFRERRTARFNDVQNARRGVEQLLARIAQAAGVEPPSVEQPTGRWVEELTRQAADQRQSAQEAVAATTDQRRRAEQTAVAGHRLATAIARRTELLARLARLDEQHETRLAWTAELAAARAAAPVAAENDERIRAEADLRHRRDRAEKTRHTAIAAVDESTASGDSALHRMLSSADLVAALGDADADIPADQSVVAADGGSEPDGTARRGLEKRVVVELREFAAARRESAGALTSLVDEAALQQPDRSRSVEMASTREKTEMALAESERRAEQLPVELAGVRTQLEESATAAAAVPGIRARRDELIELTASARELPGAEQRLAAAEAARASAVDAHQTARDLLLDLREQRLSGMAGELAGALVAGEPCAVCGSPEHPVPAEHAALVTDAQERAAVRAEQVASAEREASTAARQECLHARDALVTQLAGRSESTLSSALAETETELDAAEKLAAVHQRRTDQLAVLEAESAESQRRRAALQSELASIRSEEAHLNRVIAERSDRLTTAAGGYPDVAARRGALLRAAELVDELADRLSAVVEAIDRLAARRHRVAVVVTEAGFDDLADALESARDEASIGKLDEALRQADRDEAALRAELADPEVVAAENSTPPDLAALDSTADEARRAAEEAVARLRAAEAADSELADLLGRWTVAERELAPIEADYATLDALTDVVNGRGQNNRKMSLRSYVLAARLEEVAVAATRRLQRMSQGRYSFVHSDAAGSRGKRGGLWLDVIDDYSGRARSAKTLSGGESFLASLALALGLADVVAAETGGALLDTLFVDEGFGSLDADTLDLVMDTLDELRAGGRVVGLVSHVEELRQRIPTRLRVRRSRTGSTLEMEMA
ncbi:AAA family ATPase [Actinoalloteichus hymeniacidonis]|uniref:Nuclease SbcCD subunit C n=1 Tax=Actinoalloteichus hymeniacidonis TaxID=340345 RepID=A0AAC9HM26_9PSEU|nr:SMC family ATPase [Actinoalloteichus hymeniacidonis]AOS61676.1 ATP-dependent dsDNA exonuclease [Actinoalloteichus hymeniacidonis]MBB5910310.1 exonuclease SbcC [Actinoalloteichus hymeniacidonis]